MNEKLITYFFSLWRCCSRPLHISLPFSDSHCFCCVCVCVSLLQIDDKVLPNRCCNRNSKPFEIIILSWAFGVHKARRVQIARCRPERENQENQTFPNLMEHCSSVRRFIHSLKLFYCRKIRLSFFFFFFLLFSFSLTFHLNLMSSCSF